jgi:preprotein translocase subunit SecF
MELFKGNKVYLFMKKSKMFIYISIFFVLSAYLLIGFKGLNWGIDFAGGTLIQVKYEKEAPISKMREALKRNNIFNGATITKFGAIDEVIIRVKNASNDLNTDLGDIARETLKNTGTYEIRRVDIVGPKVGNELREKGLISMVLAILGILIYVSFRFEWRFAVASVFALIHDVSIVIGFLTLFSIDINLDILAALLTILGYSLNDTIIVFDRIREGAMNDKSTDIEEVINTSVSKTLSRTTLTSLTTFFVVLALFIYGGEIIHGFSFALLVGVVIGTYSSIFIASPMLMIFGFSIKDYREKLALKLKSAKEKEKLRAQFEQGTI